MDDRIPTPGQEGRVLITPENGSPPFYATIAMADNPRQPGTPLNKANLLQDGTAGLYGKDASAVPNDLFAYLGKFAQYCWRRRAFTPARMNEEVKSNFSIMFSVKSSVGGDLYSYESVTVEDSGKLVSSEYIYSGSIGGYIKPEFYGRFFRPYAQDLIPYYNYAFFKIPSGVTATWNEDYGDPTYKVALVCPTVYVYTGVPSSFGPEEFVFSPNPGAYPDAGISGGYLYEKLGVPYELSYLNDMSLHFFSYDGQGRGTSYTNPVKFTAERPIKLLCIFRFTRISNPENWGPTEGAIFLSTAHLFTSWTPGMGLGGTSKTYGRCSEDRKTIEWYVSGVGSSAGAALDAAGIRYYGFYIS